MNSAPGERGRVQWHTGDPALDVYLDRYKHIKTWADLARAGERSCTPRRYLANQDLENLADVREQIISRRLDRSASPPISCNGSRSHAATSPLKPPLPNSTATIS